MFPALAVFANHPQSSGMFLSVTTWVEQSAAMFFIPPCGGLQKHLPYLQTIRNPAACFYQLCPGWSSLPAMFFILPCGGLAKSRNCWRALPVLPCSPMLPHAPPCSPMLPHALPYLPISIALHTGVRFTTPVCHILCIRGQWYIWATPSPSSGAFFTCRIHREEVFLYSKS